MPDENFVKYLKSRKNLASSNPLDLDHHVAALVLFPLACDQPIPTELRELAVNAGSISSTLGESRKENSFLAFLATKVAYSFSIENNKPASNLKRPLFSFTQ